MTDQHSRVNWSQKVESIRFETRAFIRGDYCSSTSKNIFQTENPATCSELAVFPDGDIDTVDRAVTAARDAFGRWQHLVPEQRKFLLLAVAKQVEAEKET